MRIGLIEFLLILAIASLTVGPRVALFVDRWMRRANRANAMAARRRAEYAAQMAAERDAMLKRFRTASTVFGVGILLVLVYALGFRPIDTPPQIYKAPDLRQETGAMQTAVSTDRKTRLELGEYQGVDCIRAKDGLLYAAAWNGAALKKRTSDPNIVMLSGKQEYVESDKKIDITKGKDKEQLEEMYKAMQEKSKQKTQDDTQEKQVKNEERE